MCCEVILLALCWLGENFFYYIERVTIMLWCGLLLMWAMVLN